MKKFIFTSIAASFTLALGACGTADNANEAATAENVEMPAEEAMTEAEPAAAPMADPSAKATGDVADMPNGPVPDATAAPEAGAASQAAEAATSEAEKKM